jgi:chromosome segregation ATPase
MTAQRLTPADLADVRARLINLMSPDVGPLCAEIEAAWADVERLKRIVTGLADRVAAQSELLSKRAERGSEVDRLEARRDRLAGAVREAVELLEEIYPQRQPLDVAAVTALLAAALAEGEG